MERPSNLGDSLEHLPQAELIRFVRELACEVARLKASNEDLAGALSKLRIEHQGVKDELARLKHLPRVRR